MDLISDSLAIFQAPDLWEDWKPWPNNLRDFNLMWIGWNTYTVRLGQLSITRIASKLSLFLGLSLSQNGAQGILKFGTFKFCPKSTRRIFFNPITFWVFLWVSKSICSNKLILYQCSSVSVWRQTRKASFLWRECTSCGTRRSQKTKPDEVSR